MKCLRPPVTTGDHAPGFESTKRLFLGVSGCPIIYSKYTPGSPILGEVPCLWDSDGGPVHFKNKIANHGFSGENRQSSVVIE